MYQLRIENFISFLKFHFFDAYEVRSIIILPFGPRHELFIFLDLFSELIFGLLSRQLLLMLLPPKIFLRQILKEILMLIQYLRIPKYNIFSKKLENSLRIFWKLLV